MPLWDSISDMDERSRKLLSSLQNQCARREYCSTDMFRKAVTKLEGDRNAAEEIVAALVKDSYIDDLRYASAFAREKSGMTGWGPIKIRMALSAKGMSTDTIDSALEGIDGERADAKLTKLLESKWKSLSDDPQGKLKLLRFALSRGYRYDQIRDIVDEITSQSA